MVTSLRAVRRKRVVRSHIPERLWWIRVPWRIRCIPVPHANCENIRLLRRLRIEAAISL